MCQKRVEPEGCVGQGQRFDRDVGQQELGCQKIERSLHLEEVAVAAVVGRCGPVGLWRDHGSIHLAVLQGVLVFDLLGRVKGQNKSTGERLGCNLVVAAGRWGLEVSGANFPYGHKPWGGLYSQRLTVVGGPWSASGRLEGELEPAEV